LVIVELTFVLEGKAKLPPTAPPTRATPLDAPEFVIDPAAVELGTTQYVSRCVLCHGPAAVAGGTAPDLRASTVPLSLEAFAQIRRGGALEARGMPRFAELTDAELDAIRHYLRARAREALHQPAK